MAATEIQEVLNAWSPYLESVTDWQELIEGVIPKSTGCGPVYEIDNPIPNRPNESFAIADMRDIAVTEPHYHPNGEYEIYVVLAGVGKIVNGGTLHEVVKGSVVATPPDTTHFTIPEEGLVLAVINTPPFNPNNYVPITETDESVKFDKGQFKLLTTGSN